MDTQHKPANDAQSYQALSPFDGAMERTNPNRLCKRATPARSSDWCAQLSHSLSLSLSLRSSLLFPRRHGESSEARLSAAAWAPRARVLSAGKKKLNTGGGGGGGVKEESQGRHRGQWAGNSGSRKNQRARESESESERERERERREEGRREEKGERHPRPHRC